ncbi:hypothetical protein BOTBODRAFT_181373 [Botryobasidium botryosum FD-172 SS1]|uniref:DNA 3'-5' helicase n=1 Tax=Botryobasidium botryosum (strain FD-172 SS1) TaxID=930990 RepID=A0A067LTP5_BOTB1|nr:hypothetical protein BOTBODRAFT_181373 [Botryobasidium botryosum FD-172 SS1]
MTMPSPSDQPTVEDKVDLTFQGDQEPLATIQRDASGTFTCPCRKARYATAEGLQDHCRTHLPPDWLWDALIKKEINNLLPNYPDIQEISQPMVSMIYHDILLKYHNESVGPLKVIQDTVSQFIHAFDEEELNSLPSSSSSTPSAPSTSSTPSAPSTSSTSPTPQLPIDISQPLHGARASRDADPSVRPVVYPKELQSCGLGINVVEKIFFCAICGKVPGPGIETIRAHGRSVHSLTKSPNIGAMRALHAKYGTVPTFQRPTTIIAPIKGLFQFDGHACPAEGCLYAALSPKTVKNHALHDHNIRFGRTSQPTLEKVKVHEFYGSNKEMWVQVDPLLADDQEGERGNADFRACFNKPLFPQEEKVVLPEHRKDMSPWLIANTWPKHIEGYDIRELRELASFPDHKEEKTVFRVMAMAYRLMARAQDKLTRAKRAVMDAMSPRASSDAKEDSRKRPFRPLQEDKTLREYSRSLGRLFTMAMREARGREGDYHLPYSEKTLEAAKRLFDQLAKFSEAEMTDMMRSKQISPLTEKEAQVQDLMLDLATAMYTHQPKGASTDQYACPVVRSIVLMHVGEQGQIMDAFVTAGRMSQMQWCLRAVFYLEAERLAAKPDGDFQGDFLKALHHLKKWYTEDAFEVTPYSAIAGVMSLASGMIANGRPLPDCFWMPASKTQFAIQGKLFDLDSIKTMMTTEMSRVGGLLRKLTLGRSPEELGVLRDHYADNPNRTTPGYSFIQEPANDLRKHHDQLLTIILSDPKLKAQFIQGVDEETGRIVWNAEASQDMLETDKEFIEAVMVILMGVTPPPRGSELTPLKFENLTTRVRNFLRLLGRWATVLEYHKGSSITGRDKIIPRFLPPVLGDAIMTYLTVVRPLITQMAIQHYQGDAKMYDLYRTQLFVVRGRPVQPDQLSLQMRAISRKYMPNPLGIRTWRQANTLIHDRYFGFRAEDCAENEIGHLLAGHTTGTVASHYGLDEANLPTISARTMHLYLYESRRWSALYGFESLPELSDVIAPPGMVAIMPHLNAIRDDIASLRGGVGLSEAGEKLAVTLEEVTALLGRVGQLFEDLPLRGNARHEDASPSSPGGQKLGTAGLQITTSESAPTSLGEDDGVGPIESHRSSPEDISATNDLEDDGFCNASFGRAQSSEPGDAECLLEASRSPARNIEDPEASRHGMASGTGAVSVGKMTAVLRGPEERAREGGDQSRSKRSASGATKRTANPDVNEPALKVRRREQGRPLAAHDRIVANTNLLTMSKPWASAADKVAPSSQPPGGRRSTPMPQQPPASPRILPGFAGALDGNNAGSEAVARSGPFAAELPDEKSMTSAIQDFYGKADAELRPNQYDMIYKTLQRQSCLAIFAHTGSGKSLTYMIPASKFEIGKTTLVVVPTNVLLEDVIRRSREAKLSAAAWTSETPTANAVSIMPLTIDSADTRSFMAFVNSLSKQGKLARIVIDEAHNMLMSQGYRPAYRTVFALLEAGVPLLFLSATMLPKYYDCLREHAWITDLMILRAYTYQRQVSYRVLRVAMPLHKGGQQPQNQAQLPRGHDDMLRELKRICQEEEKRFSGFSIELGIVYCQTVEMVKRLGEELQWPICHGQQKEDDRRANLGLWTSGKAPIILATTILSEGVDYPGVRFTVHFGCPYSFTDYLQGSGRAGRDGRPSRAYVIYSSLWKPLPKHALAFSAEQRAKFDGDYGGFEEFKAWLKDETRCRRVGLGEVYDGRGFTCQELLANECDVCCQKSRKINGFYHEPKTIKAEPFPRPMNLGLCSSRPDDSVEPRSFGSLDDDRRTVEEFRRADDLFWDNVKMVLNDVGGSTCILCHFHCIYEVHDPDQCAHFKRREDEFAAWAGNAAPPAEVTCPVCWLPKIEEFHDGSEHARCIYPHLVKRACWTAMIHPNLRRSAATWSEVDSLDIHVIGPTLGRLDIPPFRGVWKTRPIRMLLWLMGMDRTQRKDMLALTRNSRGEVEEDSQPH